MNTRLSDNGLGLSTLSGVDRKICMYGMGL